MFGRGMRPGRVIRLLWSSRERPNEALGSILAPYPCKGRTTVGTGTLDRVEMLIQRAKQRLTWMTNT